MLSWACRYGRLDMFKLLISKGADVRRSTTSDGWTILMAASHHGHLDCAALCLELGVDIDGVTTRYDFRGATALHIAAECGKQQVVELLVDSGADLSIRNKVTILLSVLFFFLISFLSPIIQAGKTAKDCCAQVTARKYIQNKGQQPRRFGGSMLNQVPELYDPPIAPPISAFAENPILGASAPSLFADNINNSNDPFFVWLKELGLEDTHAGLLKAGIRTKKAVAIYESKEELLTDVRESGYPEFTIAQARVLLGSSKQ